MVETGIGNNNKIILEQKKENESLRNRYDNLFKELDDYRKKNSELSNELRQIKQELTSMNYENENYEIISEKVIKQIKKRK